MADVDASLWRSVGALPATDPTTWLATHLAPRHQHDETWGRPDHESTFSDLVDSEIEQQHQRLVEAGVPAPAAAQYVVGWYGGILAAAVGFGLAVGRCGFVVDPQTLSWQIHSDGWAMGVTLGPRAVVEPDHPWCGQPDVEVVADASAVTRRAVDQLIEVCTPMVERSHGLAKVGRIGLWNEIGDALAGALTYEIDRDVTEAQVAALRSAEALSGVPWRAHARLDFVDSPSLGPVHVMQRGGCCLAYTEQPEVTSDSYCLTCSLRDPEDSFARQRAWIEDERAGRHTE